MSTAKAPSTAKADPKAADDDGRTAHVRLVSSTRREKTAKEAERSLDAKIARARAGEPVPETPDPTPEDPAPWTKPEGEPAGLAPVTTVRPMPAITPKVSGKTGSKKTSAKSASKTTTTSSDKTAAEKQAKVAVKAADKSPDKARAQKSSTSDGSKTDTVAETANAAASKPTKASAKATTKVSTKVGTKPAKTGTKVSDHTRGQSADTLAQCAPDRAQTSVVTAAPTTGLLASLIGFAPAGVAVDSVPEIRPQRGEVIGSPASTSQGTLAMLTAQAAAEAKTDCVDNGDAQAAAASRVPDSHPASSGKVLILSPETEPQGTRPTQASAPSETTTSPSDDKRQDVAPYHTTVELTGRRSAPKRKAELMEPERETIDLETEALADDAVAEMTLLKRRAARQPQRDELEARMARAGVEAAGLTPKGKEAQDFTEKKAGADASLWANDARRANTEHQARIETPSTPVYDFVSDDPTVPMRETLDHPEATDARLKAAADYAERMTEWENRVIDDANRRDRLTSPYRRQAPGERIPVVTAANETLGGFPAAKDVRPWVNVSGTDLPPPPPTFVARVLGLLSRLDRWCLAWQGLHCALKTSLIVLGSTLVAAVAAGLTAQAMVPGLTERHTPVSVTAVVADNEIRDLMMLVSLLEARQVSIGRAVPTVSLTHLPYDLRATLEADTPAARMALPLDDRLLKAALRETADWVGAPILSKSVVLAMPDVAHGPIGRTLDVTEEVVKRLGLSDVSAAAAKEALNVVLSPKHEPNLKPFAFDRLTGKTPTDADDPAGKPGLSRPTPVTPLREEATR